MAVIFNPCRLKAASSANEFMKGARRICDGAAPLLSRQIKPATGGPAGSGARWFDVVPDAIPRKGIGGVFPRSDGVTNASPKVCLSGQPRERSAATRSRAPQARRAANHR
jgi:hypothetical protein